MDVPLWVWALTVGVVVGLLVVDFVGHVRRPHGRRAGPVAAGEDRAVGAVA